MSWSRCSAVLQTWDETRDAKLLPLIGLFAGFGYAIKPTAYTAVIYAVAFVLYKTARSRSGIIRPIVVVSAFIVLMIAPWLIKNAITVANPFSPFLNAWFPNPYIRISAEESYRWYMQHYDGLKSYWDIPLELTVRGAILNGFFGPAFLLAPLGVLSLRWKFGRQVAFGGGRTRIHISGECRHPISHDRRAVRRAWRSRFRYRTARALAPLLIAFQIFVSWPDNVLLYAHPYAWRVEKFYWDAAFRKQPESEYLSQRIEGYAAAKLADQHVPKDGVIFTPGGIAHAYCRRKVLVGYQSAMGNRIADYIATAVTPSLQPSRWWTYSFPRQSIRKLRLIHTGAATSNRHLERQRTSPVRTGRRGRP